MNGKHQNPSESCPPESDDEAKYEVLSRMEILSVLRAVMENNTLVAACFKYGSDFVLTSILSIDADAGEMIIDYGANEELNRKMLKSEGIMFTTFQDRVKVKFLADRIDKTRFDGRDAFRVGLPNRLVRLQHREYYRISTPVSKPIKCLVPLPLESKPAAEVIVLDISCGGIAVIDHDLGIDFELGVTFPDCRIVLPDIGTVTATIQVKNISEITLKNGTKRKRSGCEFVSILENMMMMIQRYVIKLERERNAKSSGR